MVTAKEARQYSVVINLFEIESCNLLAEVRPAQDQLVKPSR